MGCEGLLGGPWGAIAGSGGPLRGALDGCGGLYGSYMGCEGLWEDFWGTIEGLGDFIVDLWGAMASEGLGGWSLKGNWSV